MDGQQTMPIKPTFFASALLTFGAITMLAGCHNSDPGPNSVLPLYTQRLGEPIWLSLRELADTAARKLPEFVLTDQNGQAFTPASLQNKFVVANFFFSQCRNQCPQLTAGMKRLQQAFSNNENILLLSHSVAVGLDSPATLNAFATINGVNSARWRLLSGDAQVIDQMARDIYWLPDIVEGRDRLVHSELFVLLDNKQRVRGFYNGSLALEIDNLIHDLTLLQKEL